LRATASKSNSPGGLRSATQAVEQRKHDRSFYSRGLIALIIVVVLAAGFLVCDLAVRSSRKAPGPSIDLGSLFKAGSNGLPDPFNPSVVIQEHLEATRRGSYRLAYDLLSAGLKTSVSYDGFVENAKSNSLLFQDISGYRFSGYEVNGTAATAGGYIEYRKGGSSRVEAAFAREGDRWRISEMNIIFQ
jgi:hypothetical protein